MHTEVQHQSPAANLLIFTPTFFYIPPPTALSDTSLPLSYAIIIIYVVFPYSFHYKASSSVCTLWCLPPTPVSLGTPTLVILYFGIYNNYTHFPYLWTHRSLFQSPSYFYFPGIVSDPQLCSPQPSTSPSPAITLE